MKKKLKMLCAVMLALSATVTANAETTEAETVETEAPEVLEAVSAEENQAAGEETVTDPENEEEITDSYVETEEESVPEDSKLIDEETEDNTEGDYSDLNGKAEGEDSLSESVNGNDDNSEDAEDAGEEFPGSDIAYGYIETVSEDGYTDYIVSDYQTADLYLDGESNEDLPQLDEPFGLEWGKYYTKTQDGESVIDCPGYITWRTPELTQNQYLLKIYNAEGTEVNGTRYINNYSNDGRCKISIMIDSEIESGDYYFTVNTIGDQISYSDSNIVQSDIWHYDRPNPEVHLEPAKNIEIEGRKITWQIEGDTDLIGGYYVSVYYSETEEERGITCVGYPNFNPSVTRKADMTYSISIGDDTLERYGPGFYSASVRVLSKDVTKVLPSELIYTSEPSNITVIAKNMESEYRTIVDKAESENMSASDIRDTAQGLDKNELKIAMLTDRSNTGVVEAMEELENKIGGSEIVVKEDMKSSFNEEDLKMVGAALNTPENAKEKIKLVIDKPEREDIIPPLFNSTVAIRFSMDLENVENTEDLKVPVKILIPVPENINPNFLVILHYHVDGGTPEYIYPVIIGQNGKKFASIVVTSFSDFIITTTEKDIPAKTQFSDVTDPSEFYYDYVYDMAEKGVVQGYSDGTFRPYNDCNRAAVVTFLWRLMGKPEPAGTSKFSDPTGTEDFDKAISWAAENGITTGWKEDNTFRPWVTCNRAAVVTFLWRAAGKPEPKEAASFSDMTGNEDFDKAISWAAENGITTGWEEDNTFRPWRTCNRLAIVSFLARYNTLINSN